MSGIFKIFGEAAKAVSSIGKATRTTKEAGKAVQETQKVAKTVAQGEKAAVGLSKSAMGSKKALAAGGAAVAGGAYLIDPEAVGDWVSWFGHAAGDVAGDLVGGVMDGAGINPAETMNTVLFVAGGVVILYVVMR